MYEQISARKEESPLSTVSQGGLSEGGISNSALLSSLGGDTPPDPNLGNAMNQRIAAAMGGFSPAPGRDLTLPAEVKSSVEGHFGHTVDNLRFQESSDVTALGAKAYAQGNVIHFAPGQFRPDTTEGKRMLGHEIAHIQQQSRGGLGSGGEINLNPALEHAADLHGDAIAAGESVLPSAPLSPMPTAPVSAAPVQGWGISVSNNLRKRLFSALPKRVLAAMPNGLKDWGTRQKGEHETLTEEARKNVLRSQNGQNYAALDQKKNARSLIYGSRFNDVGKHSAIGMALQMVLLKKDAFINQTHHGDMQFLHSMDTSNGDTAANVAKTQRYAKFASDTFQNRTVEGGGTFQQQNMLDYVLSQNEGNDPFQEMMMSTMIDPKALEKFDAQFAKTHRGTLTADDRRERTAALKRLVTVDEGALTTQAGEEYDRKGKLGRFFAGKKASYIKKKLKAAHMSADRNKSSYAKGSVADFFTNGKKKLDAGYVALGSASHMLEDSFAGSHSIRADNLYANQTPDTELTDTGATLVDKATPIITNADYNQQNNNPLWGRHGKGDKFVSPFKGASIDRTLTNTQGGSLARDSAAQFIKMNMDMKANGSQDYQGSGLNNFVEGILQADPNALHPGMTTTTTGRAYAKDAPRRLRWKQPKNVRKAMKSYYKMTGDHLTGNSIPSVDDRNRQLGSEIEALQTIMAEGNDQAREFYMPHVNESIVNLQSMIEQLLDAGNIDAARLLEARRATLVQLKANYQN